MEEAIKLLGLLVAGWLLWHFLGWLHEMHEKLESLDQRLSAVEKRLSAVETEWRGPP